MDQAIVVSSFDEKKSDGNYRHVQLKLSQRPTRLLQTAGYRGADRNKTRVELCHARIGLQIRMRDLPVEVEF
jgi:hypothetical protein